MSITVNCPHCLEAAEAELNTVGHMVPCPSCGKEFRVQPPKPQEDLSTNRPVWKKASPPARAPAPARQGVFATEEGGRITDVTIPFSSVFSIVFKVVMSLILLSIVAGVIWFIFAAVIIKLIFK